MMRTTTLALLSPLALLLPATAAADPFPAADRAAGQRMHAEMCIECHARRFGDAAGAEIYTRFDRRVSTPGALEQQLTACTAMLDLDLFPEDEHHIAGYLNDRYYKFK